MPTQVPVATGWANIPDNNATFPHGMGGTIQAPHNLGAVNAQDLQAAHATINPDWTTAPYPAAYQFVTHATKPASAPRWSKGLRYLGVDEVDRWSGKPTTHVIAKFTEFAAAEPFDYEMDGPKEIADALRRLAVKIETAAGIKRPKGLDFEAATKFYGEP